MKKALSLMVAFFMSLPVSLAVGQVTTMNAETTSNMDMGRDMDPKAADLGSADWKSYSFERKDEVVDLLKRKQGKLDDKIDQIKRSEVSDDAKRADIDKVKDKKREIDSLIKRVKASTSESWQQVIDEVSDDASKMDVQM